MTRTIYVQAGWAVFNFGTVTSGGVTSSINDAQIFIEWDAVMLDTALNATDYWISAGALYNNQTDISINSAYTNMLLDAFNGVRTVLSFHIYRGPRVELRVYLTRQKFTC